MDHLRFESRPELRRPVLIAAFEGWNDAGEAASSAALFLKGRLEAERFASIDPEEFFDFQSTRPRVRLSEGLTREITWPANELSSAPLPDGSRDAILLIGTEPQLRWRTFTELVISSARDLGVELVVTLGALLADLPHTRPVQVTGTAATRELAEELGLATSRYEGPTGIVGVLHTACGAAGLPSVSLWATVPHYISATPDPRATLALIERLRTLLECPVDTTELQAAVAGYEQRLQEIVAGDEEIAAYVRRLEERADELAEQDHMSIPTGEELAAELEQFLRERRDDTGVGE